ncbi:hypothetical protein EV126DRAFT_250439 [Verticillium dahliae]|nr:hypothetical protein EV126DRAFT_250439 [Verticillium dahliae]
MDHDHRRLSGINSSFFSLAPLAHPLPRSPNPLSSQTPPKPPGNTPFSITNLSPWPSLLEAFSRLLPATNAHHLLTTTPETCHFVPFVFRDATVIPPFSSEIDSCQPANLPYLAVYQPNQPLGPDHQALHRATVPAGTLLCETTPVPCHTSLPVPTLPPCHPATPLNPPPPASVRSAWEHWRYDTLPSFQGSILIPYQGDSHRTDAHEKERERESG